MRGRSGSGDELFSFVRLEERVPADHPLRAIRGLADEVLAGLSGSFSKLYAHTGRPSIPPEMLLRATLLQALYSVRSERMLMEQINYNLLFRWFVGLSMDAAVWHPTGFTHNRDRLLQADVARAFLQGLLALKQVKRLLSSELSASVRSALHTAPPEMRKAYIKLFVNKAVISKTEIQISGPKQLLTQAADGPAVNTSRSYYLCSRMASPRGFEPLLPP